jgi:4-amino-4-deoxy-L-arabinose transferase-like glycosyltransferase
MVDLSINSFMNRLKNCFLRFRDHRLRRGMSRCFGSALRSHWPLLCVLAVAIFFNLYWHHTHRQIPVVPAHESHFTGLEQIIEFKQAPFTYLVNLYSHASNELFFSLYNLSAALPTAIFGMGYRQMALTSLLYYILAILFVYGAARRLVGPHGALPAAIIVALIPEVFLWSVIFNSRIAVIAAAACALYLLARSENLTRPLPNLGLLILVIISLFLGETVGENVQVALLTAWGGIYLLIVQLAVRGSGWKQTLIWFGAFAATATALALFGYFSEGYLNKIISYLFQEAVVQSDVRDASGRVFSNPIALLAYPIIFYHKALFPMFTFLCAISVAILAIRFKKKDGLALVALLGPLLVVSLISKKDFCYVLFLLPAIAIVIGVAVSRLRGAIFYYAITPILILIGGTVLYGLSFPSDSGPSKKMKYDTAMNKYKYLYFGPPDFLWTPPASEYAPEKIAAEISDTAKRRGNISVIFLSDNTKDDAAMFRYFLTLKSLDDQIEIIDPFQRFYRSRTIDVLGKQSLAQFKPDYIVDYLHPNCIKPMPLPNALERFDSYISNSKQNPTFNFTPETFAKFRNRLARVPWEQYDFEGFEYQSNTCINTVLVFKYRPD